ncbi:MULTISPECIES: flagellar hook-basal body complex protein FliE [Roseobacteraceae]|uniref:Flagellar hook-basal body complex protein FliE n=1 Tax=Celeribacter baekdonensis B30 TaxID=1208323 RepID=K2JHQ7_9RHOB|nr:MULTISPECIES: flagellar hook-basal body complex protein FliE [Roseobacteraceae]EKE74673.1 flagellar hook-basal body protein FliE [Celeribacter baekdonensis B30]KAB6714724.1 flagellar hook-basal body protein FliE [Roseobacter sp. TSBP12]|tara:strand:+ start:14633 stop:14929 length:297 start_codon:yes stop_codon:yes gene_type:complete
MDIRSAFAAQGYASTRPATAPKPGVEGQSTQNAFGQAAASFADTLRQGDEVAQAAMSGKADSQSLVQALAQTELAVEAAVTVRDKVVEAYQEILRMPV